MFAMVVILSGLMFAICVDISIALRNVGMCILAGGS